MLKITTTAEVTYTCFLTGEQEKMVCNHAEKNNLSLTKALAEIYFSDEGDNLDLYKDAVESDFCTTDITNVFDDNDDDDD